MSHEFFRSRIIADRVIPRFAAAALTLQLIVCLSLLSSPVVAADWSCSEVAPENGEIDAKLQKQLKQAFASSDYKVIESRLLALLPHYPVTSKIAIYDSLVYLYGSIGKPDELQKVYRTVFDLNGAPVNLREVARDSLASLLVRQAKPDQAIALYEVESRPRCQPMTAATAAVLGRAYFALEKFDKAREIVQSANAEVLTNDLIGWNDWMLLRLRIDCRSKDWQACGSDLESFLTVKLPQVPPIDALNLYLAAFREIPTMKIKLDELTRRGLLTEKGFSTDPWKYDTDPAIVSCAPISYPAEARRNHIEGYVDVRGSFDTAGTLIEEMIVEANPSGYFETTVLAALKQCKFVPPLKNGVALPFVVKRRWNFSLNHPG